MLGCLCAVFAGCDAGYGGDLDARSPAELGLGDRYRLSETWDVSAALEPEALGELASELAIDFAVGALGVPEAVEDEARLAAADRIGDQISAPVASAVSTSAKLSALRRSIESVDVISEWIFDEGDDRSRVLRATYRHDVQVSLDLSPAARGVEIAGRLRLSSAGGADRARVAPFDLAIGLGELLRPAAEAPLEEALSNIDCAALANALTGGTGELTITAGDTSYSQTAADISSYCESQIESLPAALIDEIDRELRLQFGGEMLLTGDPATAIASADSWAGTIGGAPLAASFFGVTADGVGGD